jgi:hypothetical protein
MRSRDLRGERSRQEVSDGSALPTDYAATHIRLASYAWHSRGGNHGERELFPGTSTLALAAIGMVPPLTAAGIATIAAGALTFDWSLGLKGLTYDDLYKRSVVFRGMRVPARFSVVVGAALALLAAVGSRRIILLSRGHRGQAAVAVALAVAVLIDLRLDPRIQAYPHAVPTIYDRLEPGAVVVNLPRFHDTEYMYFSTRAWPRLLEGYSGYIPVNPALQKGLEAFPGPDGIAALKRAGAQYIVHYCSLEPTAGDCAWVNAALDGQPDLQLVRTGWDGAEIRVYRLK